MDGQWQLPNCSPGTVKDLGVAHQPMVRRQCQAREDSV